MNFYTSEQSYQIFLSMQCSFSKETAKYIFGSECDHYWKKWLGVEGNIIAFLSRLDISNRHRMYKWSKTLV